MRKFLIKNSLITQPLENLVQTRPSTPRTVTHYHDEDGDDEDSDDKKSDKRSDEESIK